MDYNPATPVASPVTGSGSATGSGASATGSSSPNGAVAIHFTAERWIASLTVLIGLALGAVQVL